MNQKTESICFNCNSFFPDTMQRPTEFGICLEDPAFEPFIDALFEDPDIAPCHELIQTKKFQGDRQACEHFDQVDPGIEIDDDSSLAENLNRLIESGELNGESFENALLEEQLKRIDLKNIPVDQYLTQLESPDLEKQKEAVTSLGSLITLGNDKAFTALSEFFKQMPTPNEISNVHYKIRIFKYLRESEQVNKLIPSLIDELHQINSNNTTRQWIAEILQFLSSCPKKQIQKSLEQMLTDNRFSYRFKKKLKIF